MGSNGGISGGALDAAAQIAALGMEQLAWRFMTTPDQFEREMIIQIANRVAEFRDVLDNNLAVTIGKKLGLIK